MGRASEKLRIQELLERFRKTECYLDVLWQDIRVKKVREYVLKVFPRLDEAGFREKFHEMMEDWFMRGRMERRAVEDIPTNDYREIKFRLLNLLLNKEQQQPIEERASFPQELRGVGPFLMPQFLSAVGEDEYIAYHPGVLEGIKAALPNIVEIVVFPTRVESVEDYIKFNEVCKAIKERFGFRSLGEVHEFFWHGHSRHERWGLRWF